MKHPVRSLKHCLRAGGILSCLWAVAWCGSALAADEASPDKEDEGWISLFDGKTLAGWHKNPQRIGHGTGGRWTVENGEIHGEQDPPGSGNGGVLLTDRKFADFELLIDLKPDWGVDSGLFLRSNDKGQCFQMMVDYHEAGDVGHIYGEGTGGFNNRPFSLFGVYDDKKNLIRLTAKPTDEKTPPGYSISGDDWVKAWKVGDWNTARVVCVGQPPKITTWLNGAKVSEFDVQTFSGPNYDPRKVADILGREGSIAVQVHGGASWPAGAKCRWRNIKIKPR
ncbi:MAG TPA: DUF1080 domain-containing protein [Pirellulales bacterium]|nr:DUF1080 domain-containing protein [Pirellulales bacterium]